MTVREVLTTIDRMRPNGFTDGEKIGFLNVIEGRIYNEILRAVEGYRPFAEGEEERELVVGLPYTDIYIFYVSAMIDFYNGDSGRYNDTIVLFNMLWNDYAAYYIQSHKPKQVNLSGMLIDRG